MRTLAPRERRLVALLLLAAALALVQTVIIGPIVAGFRDRAAQRETLLAQYAANQRLIDSTPRLRRQADRQRADLAGFVLSAPTPAIASAALQKRVQGVVESVGGELRSTQESTGDDGLVRARVAARTTLAQLARLLGELQNQQPYVNVDSLTIAADQAVISGQLEPLDVSLEVSVPYNRANAR